MYKIEKRFSLPIGHRLSKHAGRCSSIHGHNITVLVGVQSKNLNENDMVIDFSRLKEYVQEVVLDQYDHCLLLNQTDEIFADYCLSHKMRVLKFNCDPTAEVLSKRLFDSINDMYSANEKFTVDYVTVFENEDSKCTYVGEKEDYETKK